MAAVEEEAVPNLLDLAYVTVNVETREGEQFAMMLAPETEDEVLSLEVNEILELEGNAWQFTVRKRSE